MLCEPIQLSFQCCVLAFPTTCTGDDVDKKKPNPLIYQIAAQKLGVPPSDCVVVEDSTIGLEAALGAGMRCIITYTPSTKQQVGCVARRPTVVSLPNSYRTAQSAAGQRC